MIQSIEAMDKRIRLMVRGLLLAAAAVLLLASARMPWWSLTMWAPQYPAGLTVTSDLVSISGDVEELDMLNHYIGMMPLNDAAQLERTLVPYALPVFGVLALLSLFTRRRWAWLLSMPLMSFPLVFLADLKVWLWYAGNNLDPHAPLNNTISGFTPTMLGQGLIAQFQTWGVLTEGFYLALVGSLLALLATWLAARGGERGAA